MRAVEEPGWRQRLKEGDKVDVLKSEKEPLLMVGWTTGIVMERKEELLVVAYDGETEALDKIFPILSDEIAPYGTHTGGKEWRTELKKGSQIDCIDSVGVWYPSTVIDVQTFVEGKAKRTVVKLFVGFRIYDESGSRKDEEHEWGPDTAHQGTGRERLL